MGNKTGERIMPRNRAIELASWAIEGLIEDDRQSAIEYLHDQMEMTIEELKFYGVELTEDELEMYDWEEE